MLRHAAYMSEFWGHCEMDQLQEDSRPVVSFLQGTGVVIFVDTNSGQGGEVLAECYG